MSEQYNPVVEAKMVTDRKSEDFGRISDVELSFDAAVAADEKVTLEKSGDFYQEDIERESNKRTVLEIGKIAAINAGVKQEAAAEVADDVMSMRSTDLLTADKDDKAIGSAMHSARELEGDAFRQTSANNRDERRAA